MAASEKVSSDGDPHSIIFYLLMGALGAILCFNVRRAADAFYQFTSSFMLGFVGSATTRTIRVVGAGVLLLSSIGLFVEIVVMLT
jgi:hypothetical protein